MICVIVRIISYCCCNVSQFFDADILCDWWLLAEPPFSYDKLLGLSTLKTGCFLNIIGKFSSHAFSLIFLTRRMGLQRRAGPSSSFLCYGKHLHPTARTHLIQTQFPSSPSCDSFLGAVKRLQGHPWLRVMIIFKCLVSATASKDLAGNIAAVHFEEGHPED